jgi:LysR family hydrogen peroxide-inducible transcriptional activator
VIRAAEDLREAAQGARAPLEGALRMAAIPTVAPFLLPRIVEATSRDWPRLRLFVREMLTGPACEALQRGAVDCVLLALPADCGEVETCEIMDDRLLVVDRIAASSADAEEEVPSAAVDPSRLLLLDEGHCLREQALAACRLPAASPESRLVASTLHTLVRMVDAGLGMTLLPEMAVNAGLLTDAHVRARALDGPGAQRRIALVWRKRTPRASDLRLLGATVREAMSA